MNSPWIKGPRFGSSVNITGGSGVPILLAQSAVAVSGAADTNENVVATITVPANAMGANGAIRVRAWFTVTNNANTKTIRGRFSGAAGTVFFTGNAASTTATEIEFVIMNRGATNSQSGYQRGSNASGGGFAGVNFTASVDTTAVTTVVISIQKGTGTDTVTLEGYIAEYLKPSA